MLPELTDRIIEQIKDLIPGTKEVFDGDPYAIATSQLPALMVETDGGTVRTGATGMDKKGETITIKYVMDKRTDFGSSSKANENYKHLKRIVWARDPNTKTWKEETLMYALRQNFTLDNVVVSQEVDVDFPVVPRPDDVLTIEAHVTFRATENVPVISRS